MNQSELIRLAESVVATAQEGLPPELRTLAQRVPVVYHDWPSDDILGEEFEPDILGMFAGSPHGEDSGDRNELPGHIMLFLGNLWEFADGDVRTYRKEVRLTYLHELGHYFGWDEDDLEVRGLG